MGEMDPRLVQAVLDEEWTVDSDELFDGRKEYIGRFGYSTEPSTMWGVERARQAALGHRALQKLVANHDPAECTRANCDACAIINELRGEK